LIDVLSEKADSIRLEPPGAEGKGVEFWLRRGDVREYHQVKRQLSEGQWTLYQLSQAEVLGNFREKLDEDDSICVFVSMYGAAHLSELANRARDASSLDEFKTKFLTSGSLKKTFSELRSHWHCSEEEGYEYLRRVFFRTYDEQSLREDVRDRLLALVEGDTALVEAFLSQLALDKIHHELHTLELWQHLAGRGFHRSKWGDDPRVLAAIDAANDRYQASFPSPTIGGHIVKRAEVEEALAAFTEDGSIRGVLLFGEAGVGKSGVLLQLFSALRARGTPLLALRVDRLEVTQRPEDIGRQLGLPGAPAAVLDAVASGRECVLVLDQLDAVSLASGRRPELFDCVAGVVRQAASRPNVFVVLACRKFDLDNDHRFRHLVGEGGIASPLPVKRLSQATVREVVAELGLDASRLTPGQVSLLEVPLHLSLLGEIAPDHASDPFDFENVTDLYDRFWDRKQDLIGEHRGSEAEHWTNIMDRLSAHMSAHQTLTAPNGIVDDFRSDVRAIVSEHVLVRDGEGRKLAFFHDGFFDYVFARRFLARGDDLLALLCGGEQGLFRRAQVRQILSFERDQTFARYLSDVRSILEGEHIRSHIKEVVFAYLGTLQNPTHGEWEVLATMSRQSGFMGLRVWTVLRGSSPWLQLLDQNGTLESWLEDNDDDLVDRVVWLLASGVEIMPERVSELIQLHKSSSEQWKRRLKFLVQRQLPSNSKWLELVLHAIDDGVLDDVNGASHFWTLNQAVFKLNPTWACAVLEHYFDRRLEVAITSGKGNPFASDGYLNHTGSLPNVLMDAAQSAPREFVERLLPFVVRTVEQNIVPGTESPIEDSVWWVRFPEDRNSAASVFLTALEHSFRRIASEDPVALERAMGQSLNSHFETIQFLIVRSFEANGVYFAEVAADYLCQHESGLRSGYTGDKYWATHELLKAITPNCSQARLERLEQRIMNYYPSEERRKGYLDVFGYAQFHLLSAVAPDRRGDKVRRRLMELQRKFGPEQPAPPRGIVVASVESPVPESALDKMSDKQWLSAMATHSEDDSRTQRNGKVVGGADEVARQLQGQASQDPDRFAQLTLQMPEDTNPKYFIAVLRGLAVSTDRATTALLFTVCEKCHALPGRPCGAAIADLLSKLARMPLPDQMLDMLGWYAVEDPDPSEALWRKTTPTGDAYFYGGNVESAGRNSVRGRAIVAIAHILFEDQSRVEEFRPVLNQAVIDKSVAVRSQVAHALTAALLYDREAAVVWFQQLCDTYDTLLESESIEEFIRYSIPTHFLVLVPLLDRMLSSNRDRVLQAGSRQCCLAALDIGEALPLADRCLSGTTPLRLGAAEIYSANLRQAGLRRVCEDALSLLFDDDDYAVREASSKWLASVRGVDLGSYQELANQFIDSTAFAEGYAELFNALEATTSSMPVVVCKAASRFIHIAGPGVSDISTREAAEAGTVSTLIIRAYEQSGDQTIRSACLDVIDRMTEMGAWGLDSAFHVYDR
jgi:hypothetical protein